MSETKVLECATVAPDGDSNDESILDSDVVLAELTTALNADIFFFSGPTHRKQATLFMEVADDAPRRENVALVLSTYGGDADAAFIIARYLKRFYKRFTLYVFGFCKSAGTLIALGADEIVMSHRGEFGPLDVQILKSDELVFRSSGLDIEQAVVSLSEQASEIFDKHFMRMIKRGSGAITTKTAADIASAISIGLISPVTAQIDPLRVGETQRAIKIASQYGYRLNADRKKVDQLVIGYPAHSFVIDFDEAAKLFGNVRQPNSTELDLERVLQAFEMERGYTCVREPHNAGIVMHINPAEVDGHEAENIATTNAQSNGEGDEQAGESTVAVTSNGDNQGDGTRPDRPATREARAVSAAQGVPPADRGGQ